MTIETIPNYQPAFGPSGKSTRMAYGKSDDTSTNDLLLKQTMEKYQRGTGIILNVSTDTHGKDRTWSIMYDFLG